MIEVLAILLALQLAALLAWIALLVQLVRRVGAMERSVGVMEKEQRETLTALYLHGYAMETEQRVEHDTRRRHLNQIQGTILGHISGAVAQLARQLGAAPPQPPIPLVRPLKVRRGARRRQHDEPTARRAAGMIAGLHRGAYVRIRAALAALIERAASVHGAVPFGACWVNLADEDGRRFALALHEASPTRLHPATLTGEGQPARQWCRSAPIAPLAAAAAVLGAEVGAAVQATHAAGAVPVVIVADGLATVAAFARTLPALGDA